MALHVAIRRFFGLALICAVPVVLAGCAPVGMALDTRGAKQIFSDTQMKTRALARIGAGRESWLFDVAVDVWKGKLMVTGLVENPTHRQDIIALLRDVPGKTAFYEHIAVVSPQQARTRRLERQRYEGEGAYVTGDETLEGAGDFWIETRLGAALVRHDMTGSVNYRSRSVRGVIFILGEAQTSEERDQILNIARRIRGVTEVVSYIDVVRR